MGVLGDAWYYLRPVTILLGVLCLASAAVFGGWVLLVKWWGHQQFEDGGA